MFVRNIKLYRTGITTSLLSGTAPPFRGRKLATWLMLLAKGESSCIKAKNTTTSLMLTSRMAYLHSNSHIM